MHQSLLACLSVAAWALHHMLGPLPANTAHLCLTCTCLLQAASLLVGIAGYALSIFVPISFICILPYEWLRWLLVAMATSTSGLFLLTNFKAPIFVVAGAN